MVGRAATGEWLSRRDRAVKWRRVGELVEMSNLSRELSKEARGRKAKRLLGMSTMALDQARELLRELDPPPREVARCEVVH